MTRRDFIQTGSLSLAGLAVADLAFSAAPQKINLKRKMKVAKNAEPPVNQTILTQRVVNQWVHYGAMGIG